MPRARRRRRRSVVKHGFGRYLLLAALVAVATVLAIGSLVEVHTQSSGFRTSTNTGYGALASRVADDSNQTGARLAHLLDTAPLLTNAPNPPLLQSTARAVLQQGLDQAVRSSSDEAERAVDLVPPAPSGTVSGQFTQVLSDRAAAVSAIRTGIDQRLGMTPLPIAGAPTPSATPAPAPLVSADQAAAVLTAAGVGLERADAAYRVLLTGIRRAGLPIHLPRSVWVPLPVAQAPLGSVRLGALIPSLDAAVSFVPYHRLIFSAVGISPPAVATGGAGTAGSGCSAPRSTVPGATPTVLPPTSSVSVAATVTNCGTVVESGVGVSETLAPADPPGAAPPASARGGTAKATVTLRAGSSVALPPAGFAVAGGHLYTLTLAIAIDPSNQLDPTGSTQQFLLQISG
ncbi:MAG TPA: hypothetical protein VIC86_09315 [Acidimicrobiales bacterium]|jgi:hypothetical protein